MPVRMSGKVITREREDYLKTIYTLQDEESPVRTTSIARSLGVEPASVTGVIKRLAELEFVDYEPYRGVTLSAEGERIALEVIRHHRLLELFLIESLGYEWDEVHDEAERLEHAVSPLFIERVSAALGNPDIDPHGSPIPTEDGRIEPRIGVPLGDLQVGQVGIVSWVDDDDPDVLRTLAATDIRPGAEVSVLAPLPGREQLHISIDQRKRLLGINEAAHVFVTLVAT